MLCKIWRIVLRITNLRAEVGASIDRPSRQALRQKRPVIQLPQVPGHKIQFRRWRCSRHGCSLNPNISRLARLRDGPPPSHSPRHNNIPMASIFSHSLCQSNESPSFHNLIQSRQTAALCTTNPSCSLVQGFCTEMRMRVRDWRSTAAAKMAGEGVGEGRILAASPHTLPQHCCPALNYPGYGETLAANAATERVFLPSKTQNPKP